MGWIREYPRVQVRHLHNARPKFGEWELTISVTPIAVRRPARGVKQATVVCRACGAELGVRVHSAMSTRVTKLLLLLLGIVATPATVALSLIMVETDNGGAIAGAWVSLFLALGGFIGCYFVDGVRLPKGGALHRLAYQRRQGQDHG
ncbi:hypothetical protein ACIBP6_08050 [Nonomuraea terrae]|uniref:hypothetical protein n=1 Tax=Nonomuraea terrae TaxID=2530383 RepID=UPI0037A96F8A